MAMTTGRSVAVRSAIFIVLLIVLGWTGVGMFRQWRSAKRLEKMADNIAVEARTQIPRNVTYDQAHDWLASHGYEVINWKKGDPKGWIGIQDDQEHGKMAVVAGQRLMTNTDFTGPVWVYLAFQFDPKGKFRELGAWPTMRATASEPGPATTKAA